jgi:hypothetical protein
MKKTQIPITSDLGYYKVGDHYYFINKTEAVHVASKYQLPISWNFNDDVFASINWNVRPTGTLAEMYRERAQQIRDTYDYVVVQFSGGMDSWTVLHSFLANGIHVDEVFTRWAFAERKYRDANSTDKDESNLGSEFEYAVKPVLDHISKNYPNTRIVVDDYSEAFTNTLADSAILASNQYQSMPTFFRFNRKSEEESQAADKGKSVGVVYGYEKIRCNIKDNNFYAYFVDTIGGVNSTPSRNVELFYWSRKFPQIPVLQAHMIKDFVKYHKELLVRDPTAADIDVQYREIYQQACYPEFNIDTFQVGKPFGSLIWKSDSWIGEYNPKYKESWKWVTDQYYNSIDQKYIRKINGITTGLKTYESPYYLIEENVDAGIDNISWLRGVFHP